jgi:hypothetical protein
MTTQSLDPYKFKHGRSLKSIRAKITQPKNVQITNKRTTIFMMYFIHNVLTSVFSAGIQGDAIITRIQNVQIWLTVSPSLHNN